MSKKLQKKVKLAVREFEESRATNSQHSQAKDNVLFSLETSGSKSGKRKAVAELAPKANKTFISVTEQHLVNKIRNSLKQPNTVTNKDSNDLSDIWGDEDQTAQIPKDNKRRKITMPLPGQSYNPTVEDHQDAIAEAVAIQLKRENATNTQIVESTSSYSDSFVQDSDDESKKSNEESKSSKKLKNKLTKAQRNKIRNNNIKGREKQQKMAQKTIDQSIDKIPQFILQMETADRRSSQKEKLKVSKRDSSETEVMTFEEIGSVPLTDELNGSLRSLKPKVVALTDRMISMKKQGDFNTSDKTGRKTRSKPHGEQNLRWHAKYKYV